MRKGRKAITLRHMKLPLLKMIDIPPVWLLVCAVIVWGLGQAAPMPTGALWVSGLGTAFVAGGLVLIGLAAWEFRQHKTTIIPHQTAARLISTGIFARSRNPIYLGDAIILFGLCLRWDILHGVLIVPVFIGLIQTRFIHAEENRLRAAFGDAFDAYTSKTRRWL